MRGLSVLLVVLHHIHVRFRLSGYETLTLPRWLDRVLFWSGYYSVITFFVISGFLITRLSLARWGLLSRIPVREFYSMRLARLGPCLLALLVVLSGLHGLGFESFRIDTERASLGRALFAALTLEDYAYFSCTDGIAFGCLSALAAARLELSRRVRRGALALGLCAILLIVVFRRQTFALGLTAFGLNVTVLELGVALALLGFGTGTGDAIAARGTRLLRAVGRASYEIYLTHMFVVLTGAAWLGSIAAKPSPGPVWYLGMLGASVGLGLLVSRYLSEPANRALRARWLARLPVKAEPERAVTPLAP